MGIEKRILLLYFNTLCFEGSITMNNQNQKELEELKNESLSALPLNALDEIPNPNANAKSIIGLTKDSGKISGYQLSDGQIVSKEQGVQMAKNGEIAGIGIAHNGDTEYLKALPDGAENNNLSHLPTVSED